MAAKNIHNLGTCQLLVEKKTLDGSAKCRVSMSLQRNAAMVNKYNLKTHAVFPAEKDVLVIMSLEYCVKVRSLVSRADTAVIHMGNIHSHSPITWLPSMCLGSHIHVWEIPSHAPHEQEIQCVVNMKNVVGQQCTEHPRHSGCIGLPKRSGPPSSLSQGQQKGSRVTVSMFVSCSMGFR